MLPRTPIHDQMDGLVTQTERSGYGCLAFAAGGSCPDGSNNFGREFLGIAVISNRMVDVASVRRPFEVVGSVIRLVEVFVVDIPKTFGIRVVYKGSRDKRADIGHVLFAFFAQHKMSVAGMVRRARQYLSSAQHDPASCFVSDKAVKALHATMVRDFVKSLVAGDWLPRFIGHDNLHLMFPMIQMKRG